jgi:hypothetical protein
MTNPLQVTKPLVPAEVIDRNAETARLVALAKEGNNARLVATARHRCFDGSKLNWRTTTG